MSVDLFASVAAGGVVLTANKRLARHLVEQFDQAQLAAGRPVWPSPAILSLDAWFMRQIQQQREEHRLLTEAQAQRIWEEIVGTDAAAAGRDLLQVPQAARRAREAHRLLQAYLADFTASDADEDQLAFLRWRKRSQERMHRDQLLERSDLLAFVTAAIAAGRGAVPSVLTLAGFDDLSPAVQQLCAALAARGCPTQEAPYSFFENIHPDWVIPTGTTVVINFMVDMTNATNPDSQVTPFVPATDTVWWIPRQPLYYSINGLEWGTTQRVLRLTDPNVI